MDHDYKDGYPMIRELKTPVVDAMIELMEKPRRNLLAEIEINLLFGTQVTGDRSGSLGFATFTCYGTRRKGDETEASEVVENLSVFLGETEITRELSEETLNEIVSYIGENC